MTLTPGTRYALADETKRRLRVTERLRDLFETWGYAAVDVPVLEPYDPAHPAAKSAFKLGGLEGDLLALRADFTPGVAKMVKLHYPELALESTESEAESEVAGTPGRFQYCGRLWRTVVPDIARTREFTEIGLELVGVSNPKADAELVHLAREAVREVGLAPRVEVGNPGFVRCLFDLAEVPEREREVLASAIDRKDVATLGTLLESYHLESELRDALLGVSDLYGPVNSSGMNILKEAKRRAPWAETREEVERLEVILNEFEDDSELLLDLGMARRLSYYTGMTFRAYTFDFGQPLLGGGRYDGALLPYAAGFAVGLERLLNAMPSQRVEVTPLVLSLDDEAARHLRAHGYKVERALLNDMDDLRRYARSRGIPYLLNEAGLEPLTAERPFYDEVRELLEVPA